MTQTISKQLKRAVYWGLPLVAVVLAVVLVLLWESSRDSTPVQVLDKAQQAEALRFARAELSGVSTSVPPSIRGVCGKHVFLELFRHRRTNYIFGASDPAPDTKLCLPEAIQDAARSLRDNSDFVRSWKPELEQARLAVSVRSTPLRSVPWKYYGQTGRGAAAKKGWYVDGATFELGIDGLLLSREHEGQTRRAIVPPMEAIAVDHGTGETLINLRKYSSEHLRRVGVEASRERDQEPDVTVQAFEVQTALEAAPGEAAEPLNPVRGNFDIGRADADDIYDTAVRQTDYLVRVLDAEGRFDYEYFPNTDRSSSDYNIVRHAGTTYSILLTHRYSGDKKYLDAGLRAKDYIARKLENKPYEAQVYHTAAGGVPVPFPESDGSVTLLALTDSGAASLGATALSLLAFSEIPKESLSAEDNRRIEQMVNFVWFLQCESGGFYTDYEEALKGKCPDPQPLFYPGETLLALNALYRVDAKPQYLEIARRSVKFELERFYKGDSADHWVMQALELLQLNLPAEAEQKDWVQAGYDMGVSYIERQYMEGRDYAKAPQRPEYVGGYHTSMGPPYNTPAGSRSEAVAGIHRLMRKVGRKADEARFGDHVLAAAWFLTRETYRPENMFYLANPEKALGGLRGTVVDQSVRIDFNQHSLVAVWGAWEVALDRGGIGWPIPTGKEAEELQRKAAAGQLITKWGRRAPKE
ncbi:MAG: hypothetical protein RJA70_693 [Pseudomonadota bacterium]|jgi:hypothetical protein